MKQVALLLSLFLCITTAAVSQDGEELMKRNGFKDLQLGSEIGTVVGATFKKDIKEKNEFPAKLYQVKNPEYASIGEVIVKKVEVKTYKDFVYEINVITDKDTRLMKGMEMAYGKPVYIIPTDTYNWKAETLSLTFKNNSKKTILLTYRCYPVLKMMAEDKGKKIEDIADDF